MLLDFILREETDDMPTTSNRPRRKGINFVVNENGEKQAVIINLKQHRALWEDFYDTLLSQERQQEPRETLDEVKQRVLGKR
jgi:hypothetical protein